jgi:hypothetical protein
VQRKIEFATWLVAPAGLVLMSSAAPQSRGSGKIVVPDSTVEHPIDVGVRAHNNHLVRIAPDAGPRFVGISPAGETPLSIRSAYNLGTDVISGGARVIAIVDAFHYVTAENDLSVFSSQFGLRPHAPLPTAASKSSMLAARSPVKTAAGRRKRRSTSSGHIPWPPTRRSCLLKLLRVVLLISLRQSA